MALDGIKPAEPANNRIGADGEHEQHDQHGVHARHVEQAVGLMIRKPMPRFESLVSASRVPISARQAQPHAVDDRMAHRR